MENDNVPKKDSEIHKYVLIIADFIMSGKEKKQQLYDFVKNTNFIIKCTTSLPYFGLSVWIQMQNIHYDLFNHSYQ